MSNYDYNTLCHHGIKGQKWGYRRYQNEDGTLTEAGKKRYRNFDEIGERQFKKDQRAIKGQQLYEKGQTSGWLAYKSGLVTSGASIGSYAAYRLGQKIYNSAAIRGYATKGESITMKVCLGAIGAMTIGAVAYNINAGIKRRQIRAYYTNGTKQLVRIDNKNKQ